MGPFLFDRLGLDWAMKNKVISTFVVCFVALGCVVVFPLFPFSPVELTVGVRNEFVRTSRALAGVNVQNIKFVLDLYNEPYWSCGGRIYIPLRLFLNKELCWNYTMKAEDATFVYRMRSERKGNAGAAAGGGDVSRQATNEVTR